MHRDSIVPFHVSLRVTLVRVSKTKSSLPIVPPFSLFDLQEIPRRDTVIFRGTSRLTQRNSTGNGRKCIRLSTSNFVNGGRAERAHRWRPAWLSTSCGESSTICRTDTELVVFEESFSATQNANADGKLLRRRHRPVNHQVCPQTFSFPPAIRSSKTILDIYYQFMLFIRLFGHETRWNERWLQRLIVKVNNAGHR